MAPIYRSEKVSWKLTQKQSPVHVLAGAWNFIKKETLAQGFPSEFFEIFKNIVFIEHLRWLLLLSKIACWTQSMILCVTFPDAQKGFAQTVKFLASKIHSI